MGLKNADYSRIRREYDNRQIRNSQILRKRHDEVYKRIPQYKELCDRIAELSIRQATLSLETDTAVPDSFYKEKELLSEQKNRLLASNGFPPDYLAPVYDCADCQDTGFLDNKPCHCFRQAVVRLLYDQSGIAATLERHNFSHFKTGYYADNYVDETTNLTPAANIDKVLAICHEFTERFDSCYDNLLFYGNTGVGKTFLTHCIAKELLDSSHTVIYLTSLQLFDILEKCKFDKYESTVQASSQLSYIMDCDLLIIDDLGTELTNSFTASQLYYLMETRDAAKHSTIFSTNLSFEELRHRYSERIFSRFTNYTFLKIIGDDIRLKKALAGNA